MHKKKDADQIRRFLQSLERQDWIRRSERRWWPKFLFHFTDIRNVAQILRDNILYSRAQVEKQRKLAVSSGSPKVLAGTDEKVKNLVRLYFRPKTPTQYHAEGVHSQQSLNKSDFPFAHCPVPVFLLFDAAAILSREDCLFSDRGLGGRGYHIGSTARELSELPWKQIYHNKSLDRNNPGIARDIVSRRNAEVVIPDHLTLGSLKFIYCRSEAEKETLLHLLSPELRIRYRSRILASTRSDLFFRKRTFIESVMLSSNHIRLRFSPDTNCPGPFALEIALRHMARIKLMNKQFVLEPPFDYRIDFPQAIREYEIRVTLDGNLVYANAHSELNLPF